MKKIEIVHTEFDTLAEDAYSSTRTQEIIERWLDKSDEGMFIQQHTKQPVQIVRFDDPYTFRTMILMYAYFDEEIETFWRLKFK